jgi:hypothetical protein
MVTNPKSSHSQLPKIVFGVFHLPQGRLCDLCMIWKTAGQTGEGGLVPCQKIEHFGQSANLLLAQFGFLYDIINTPSS